MRSDEEIKKEIEALKAIRPKVVPRSMFGTDNLAQLDAQIRVLEEKMDIDDVCEAFDHVGVAEETLSAAEYARDWLEEKNEDFESLADDWPLKE